MGIEMVVSKKNQDPRVDLVQNYGVKQYQGQKTFLVKSNFWLKKCVVEKKLLVHQKFVYKKFEFLKFGI